MITKFDTNVSSSGSSKGTGLLKWVVLGLGLYAGYKFVLKPYLDKKNQSKTDE